MTIPIDRLKFREIDARVLEFRAWREDVGMLQLRAAELLEYNADYLANVELGVKAPSKVMLAKMRALIDGWGKP
jgi:hypothetical protein